MEEPTKAIEATTATQAEAKAKPECRCAMVGHATNLLNNHVGCFGFGQDRADDTWKSSPTDAIGSLPDEIREPLTMALAAAARFLAREFEGLS